MKKEYFSKIINKRKTYIVPAMEIVTMEHQMDLQDCSLTCEDPSSEVTEFSILEDG